MSDPLFTPELKRQADAIVAHYETRRASILEVLRLLQDHHGFINRETELAVAEYLGIAPIDVREVTTFYSLFYKAPRAATRFHVCRTLSCALLGGRAIVEHLEKRLGIKAGGKTPDGQFSLDTVECLGACEIAPMMMVNDEKYVGPLTGEKIDELLDKK